LELLTLFATHLHIQVAVGFDLILVDFDRQRPDQPLGALCPSGKIRMTWVLRFSSWLIRSSHVGAFEMFVVLSRQAVKSEGFLDVFFHPGAELRIFLLPAKQPSRRSRRASSALRRSKASAIQPSSRRRSCSLRYCPVCCVRASCLAVCQQ
jgi:hypothetical protein